jgi:spoIIIJ-associated protein
MRVVEVSGRTVDEAVARALEQLGLRQEQVDVDVIREGRRGVFGIGGEDAIVRVSARESASSALAVAQEQARTARPPRGPRPPRQPRPDGSGMPGADGGRAGGRPAGRGRGFDRGGGPRGGGRFGRAEGPPRGTPVGEDEWTRVPGAPDPAPLAPPDDAEDQVDYAGRTLRDILNMLGLTETEITAREPETPGDGLGLVEQVFEVYGNNEDASDELGLLIGRRGESLSSLQYLLNVVVATKYGNDHVFGLDVEQYRRRREQTLVDMAKRIAAEVRETGDVITLEPMPPAERRIIHLTLESEPGVRTESVGQGEDRQVEVLPVENAD